MRTILFLAANPSDTARLKLDREAREVSQRLMKGVDHAELQLVQEWALRAEDLQQHLLRYRPTVVHFSGHGGDGGQLLVDDGAGRAVPLPPAALARAFHLLGAGVRCVVLNACFSAEQARAIQESVDCVVGMAAEVKDAAAIAFSGAFYQALSYGESIQTAFDLGRNQIELQGIGQEDVPQLLVRDGVRADAVRIADAKWPS